MRSRPAEVVVGTVATRAVGRIIDLGVNAGIRRDLLLDAAGVTDADLREPDARLPLAAEIALWQALARYISDPGFGVRAAGALRVRQLGLLGYVTCFSATLRDALRRVQRYSRILTEAVEFELQERRPDVALAICHPALGAGEPLAQDYRLAGALQVSREMTGIDIVPLEVAFTYRQPSSTLEHRRYFRCPIRFGAPRASMTLRPADLELPILRADETLAGYLSTYAEQVLASLVHGGTFRHTVRAVLWSLLGEGRPPLARVSESLRMSPRTLQRRLAANGTSLTHEVEEIRKAMAIALLRDRSVPVDDVAFLLGYAEPSAFFRSFRRWTGTTPGDFRDAAA